MCTDYTSEENIYMTVLRRPLYYGLTNYILGLPYLCLHYWPNSLKMSMISYISEKLAAYPLAFRSLFQLAMAFQQQFSRFSFSIETPST